MFPSPSFLTVLIVLTGIGDVSWVSLGVAAPPGQELSHVIGIFVFCVGTFTYFTTIISYLSLPYSISVSRVLTCFIL